MIEFETYQDYQNHVWGEWRDGHLNELEMDKLIILSEEYKNEDGSDQTDYRMLTEEEFNERYKDV